MFTIKPSLLLGSVLVSSLALVACGDDGGGGNPDARPVVDGAPVPDAGADAANNTPDADTTDAPPPVDADTSPSGLLRTARMAADGAVNLPINGVYVTFLKAAVGNDVAGFFVQADPTGPALFIAVDPATLTPVPAVGDEVSFDITTMGTSGMLRQATAIANLAVASSANDLSGLVQDVTAATDLVTAVGDYESELISVTATIADVFGPQGTGHVGATISTTGVTGDTNLKLRAPTTLVDSLDLAMGCTVAVTRTPMWRFNASAQVSAFTAADITPSNCPAPTVVSAAPPDGTSVLVTFDRQIKASSVLGDGSQFTFDNGLTASAAVVSGKTVTLTTNLQTGGTAYTLTVANTVTDTYDTAVGTPNTAMFNGFVTPAVVRINEVNARITNGCDLMELRVMTGGEMAGIKVQERGVDIYTFPAMTVVAGDSIIVHWDLNDTVNCNTTGVVDETVNKNDQPRATHLRNFDNAFDVWSTKDGMVGSDNVLSVTTGAGVFQDAVLLTDDVNDNNPAATSEAAAATVAAAGQWQLVGGGQPAGGFIDAVFMMNAAADLNATGTDDTGETIQRNDDDDNNDVADWVQAAQSWGTRNAGQTTP